MFVIDLTGQKFGKLTVLHRGELGNYDKNTWVCLCDCGNTSRCQTNNLRSGTTKSCGCLRYEHKGRPKTHGMTNSPEYKIWTHMKERCYNTEHDAYHRYGGRGIKICESWLESFEVFLKDMGVRPGPEYSIDRENNDGDYEPNNCRWATRKEQSRNRSGNRLVRYRGEPYIISELSEKFGLVYQSLLKHINRGKTADQAVDYLVEKRSRIDPDI